MALSRRTLLNSALTAALAASQQRRRPNFVILYTDDQGYHDLGVQGANELKTPNIDALAHSGTRFTNWYSNAPVCSPSRASLLTGRYPIRCGVPNIGDPLRASEVTLATLLKRSGYATALTGKWHLGMQGASLPNAHGFDYFYGFHAGCVDYYSHRFYWGEPRTVNFHDLWRNDKEVFEDGEYLTGRITAEAINFIRRNQHDPFFLYVAYNAVHYPMHAPKQYIERFPGLERERQVYAAMLAAVDDGVGEIRRTLDSLGLARDTLIFYQSDNGATREPRAGLNQQPARGGSNAPLRGFKFSLFEGGIRMPALMSWPGVIPAGGVVDEIGAAMDILPTFCAAAGVSPPTDRTIDGRDVLPMAGRGARSPHDALFWAQNGQLAMRQDRWKLVLDGFDADGGAPKPENRLHGEDAVWLADLSADIGEHRNVRAQNAGIAARMEGATRRWFTEDVRRN